MPSVINRLPRGLLDLLNIKAQGRNPTALLDEVRGVMDLTRFYLLGQERAALDNYNVVAGPGLYYTANTTVPASEAWLITDWSIRCAAPAAGATLTMSPAFVGTYRDYIGTQTQFVGTVGPRVVIPALSLGSTHAMNLPILLLPGNAAILNVEQCTTAAAIVSNTHLRYYVLPL